MSTRGSLIVFEGPDGVGKSTIARMLVSYLRRSGHRCEYFAFPGIRPGSLGRFVYDLHQVNDAQQSLFMHPASVQLLHVAAHVDEIEVRIKPVLEAGQHVILDRFWWSTWVYGRVRGVSTEVLDLMIQVELLHWRHIKPAKIFVLDRADTPGMHSLQGNHNLLREEYGRLALREEKTTSVDLIRNYGPISCTLKDIILRLPSPLNQVEEAVGLGSD
jgi:dTMP kinase